MTESISEKEYRDRGSPLELALCGIQRDMVFAMQPVEKLAALKAGVSALTHPLLHDGTREKATDELLVCARQNGLVDAVGEGTIRVAIASAMRESCITAEIPSEHQEPAINATPFAWRDPATIPPRDWLYGRFLIRRQVSLTVAPGGVGKSSLVAVEALSLGTGRTLLHDAPHGQSIVWMWNGEDPMDELQRRMMAACMRHGISREDIDGRLFVNSGRETEIIIARVDPRNGVTIAEPVFDALVETIRQRKIDVVTIDPFVSCHMVPENDNGAIDRVAKTYARIADITGSAIHLVHHSRKTGGAAVEIEDGRGAVALIAAARAARTLNTMTEDEAARAGIENRFRYVRIDDGKANLAPRSDKARWLAIDSQPLGNGDDIAVVTPWKWPDPFDNITPADLLAAQQAVAAGHWRENAQAKEWVGIPIAKALGLNAGKRADKAKIKGLLRTWIDNGMFVIVAGKDKHGDERSFVEVGTWANE